MFAELLRASDGPLLTCDSDALLLADTFAYMDGKGADIVGSRGLAEFPSFRVSDNPVRSESSSCASLLHSSAD